jgi:hypothetical protein
MNDMNDADRSPDAPRPVLSNVTLYVRLSREFGSRIGYDVQTGNLSASCSVQGYVWNT